MCQGSHRTHVVYSIINNTKYLGIPKYHQMEIILRSRYTTQQSPAPS